MQLGSDLMLLWLQRRPAAVALIKPLDWEPPYATGAALKSKKKKKKKKKQVSTFIIHKQETKKIYQETFNRTDIAMRPNLAEVRFH